MIPRLTTEQMDRENEIPDTEAQVKEVVDIMKKRVDEITARTKMGDFERQHLITVNPIPVEEKAQPSCWWKNPKFLFIFGLITVFFVMFVIRKVYL
ncbi:hypothetical protein HDE_01929 [Halotydeus destructor]|nr:hypothetical protein HDE_01929 [Halotydeus destructor]